VNAYWVRQLNLLLPAAALFHWFYPHLTLILVNHLILIASPISAIPIMNLLLFTHQVPSNYYYASSRGLLDFTLAVTLSNPTTSILIMPCLLVGWVIINACTSEHHFLLSEHRLSLQYLYIRSQ